MHELEHDGIVDRRVLEVIERTPGCLRVRPVYDDWHAVVEGSEQAVLDSLKESIGAPSIRCVHMPLEELFIELAGGNR